MAILQIRVLPCPTVFTGLPIFMEIEERDGFYVHLSSGAKKKNTKKIFGNP